MPGFTVALKKISLDAVGNAIKFLSVHSADPGLTGANELTGGTPAYARKAPSWNPATTDGTVTTQANKTLSTPPVFDIPPGSTVAFVGFWDAATGGNFLGSESVPTEVYNQQGTWANTNNLLTAN